MTEGRRRARARRSCTVRNPAVCIMASKRNATLYTGVTSDLRKRVWQHRNDEIGGVT